MADTKNQSNELEAKIEKALEENDLTTFARLIIQDKNLAEKYMDTVLIHEHFPSIMNGILTGIKSISDSNSESTNNVHKTIQKSCEDFSKIVSEHGDSMQQEERMKIYENIMNLNSQARDHDKENKKFLIKAGGVALGAVLLVGGLLVNKKIDADLVKKMWDEL